MLNTTRCSQLLRRTREKMMSSQNCTPVRKCKTALERDCLFAQSAATAAKCSEGGKRSNGSKCGKSQQTRQMRACVFAANARLRDCEIAGLRHTRDCANAMLRVCGKCEVARLRQMRGCKIARLRAYDKASQAGSAHGWLEVRMAGMRITGGAHGWKCASLEVRIQCAQSMCPSC
jgi:hypothetical protein